MDYDVTADVAAFLAGTPNYGWIVKKTAEGASGLVEYASREAAAGEGPTLRVVFDVPGSGDTTPPTVTLLTPPEPRIVNVARPQITAAFSDEGSEVDMASVQLLSMERTSPRRRRSQRASFDFTPTDDLGNGSHLVTISVTRIVPVIRPTGRGRSPWTHCPLVVRLLPPESQLCFQSSPSCSDLCALRRRSARD